MRLDHLLSKEIIFLVSCVIVLVACGYFLFFGWNAYWLDHLSGGLRACE